MVITGDTVEGTKDKIVSTSNNHIWNIKVVIKENKGTETDSFGKKILHKIVRRRESENRE